jgi:hypothetical protein
MSLSAIHHCRPFDPLQLWLRFFTRRNARL